ncbi:MAG: phosphonate metabolism protein/1,5-bisphosphokinase (PRPP-forming) PhnN [Rhodobacteraceae bacterium]|nr:phosphonate metabolism protein/1,5-bisphosphokinase (PRPP-forming) PhnN [Paracoccaceae bacterium]
MTTDGTLFLVVGPSGVGKDTLLDGARDRLAASRWFLFPRRVITRPAEAGGEDHIPATEAEFERQLAAGEFLHHWQAHGLRYGLLASIPDALGRGVNVVLNTSRNEIAALQAKVQNVVPIFISASPEVVARRLRSRGRESEDEIDKRLARIVKTSNPANGALELFNDSSIEAGIDALVELIAGSCKLLAEVVAFPADIGGKPICLLHRENPVARRLLAGSGRVRLCHGGKEVVAELGRSDEQRLVATDQCALSDAAMTALDVAIGDVVAIERSPSPKSRSILQKKIRAEQLSPDEMEAFVHDLVKGRFSAAEIAGFLVAASTNLTLDEVISLTRVRAEFAHRHNWGRDIVVDKHSMGGIPGNRITPIVVPIIAAFGLTMPKTSSRAITSAAGTADMMEVLARVDLDPSEMRSVVEKTGACIAWNGRLTHSPVDEVMNAINRPLGLRSALLDVSSIMSKKLAAGSSHVLIDMPLGPAAKTRTMDEAMALKALFEGVGKGVGLNTRVNISDGTRPIGRGVGPLLEAIDVLAVLRNDRDAPGDLLAKSLDYSAIILEWTGAVPEGRGRAIARDLIDSGKAMQKLTEIIECQGRREPVPEAGQFIREIPAPMAGKVEKLDIQNIASIARAAGAPRDKAAGVVILAETGQQVDANQPLIRIHSSSRQGAFDAGETARQRPPVAISQNEGAATSSE